MKKLEKILRISLMGIVLTAGAVGCVNDRTPEKTANRELKERIVIETWGQQMTKEESNYFKKFEKMNKEEQLRTINDPSQKDYQFVSKHQLLKKCIYAYLINTNSP